MASFAPIRGSRTDISNTSIVDGQFLVETDTSAQQDNRIYLDVGSNRIIVGGNANYIFVNADQGLVVGNATTEEQGIDITFTNGLISSSNRVELYSERCNQDGTAYVGSTTGTQVDPELNLLRPLRYTGMYFDDVNHVLTVHVQNLPDNTNSGNTQYYKFSAQIFI